MRRLIACLVGLGAFLLLNAASAVAHVRDPGTCDIYGYCEYFYGRTFDPGLVGNQDKDPITIVYYPSGSWDPNVKGIFTNELGWSYTSGSTQKLTRLMGTMGATYWADGDQTGQRAQYDSGSRWHARAFLGHTHPDAASNWSAASPHHDNQSHSGVDRSWQDAEDYVRSNAVYTGRENVANWTYLPRADNVNMQGFPYNGWPARINADVSGSGGCGAANRDGPSVPC